MGYTNPLQAALAPNQNLPVGDVSQVFAGGGGRGVPAFGLGYQALGSGKNLGPGVGGRQVTMPSPLQQQQPFSLTSAMSPAAQAQAAFNAKWGAVPASKALEQRNAGQAIAPGGTPQAGAE